MSASLSRQLARYAASLTYKDLPPAVVDRLKALALHALALGTAGAGTASGKAVIDLVKAEEGRHDGATILLDGARATRGGAAFANSQLMHVNVHGDSYRMLSHPGGHVVSAALATAELEHASGAAFLTALAAGYEVHCRIANVFVPAAQARGFRASPAYGIFGAALATSKALGLNEDQQVSTIALASTFASGALEGARVGGQETQYHDAHATRSGVLAALLAQRATMKGSESALEGDAGFYNAFIGNNRGDIPYRFVGPDRVDPRLVTEDLGSHYELMRVVPKVYPGKGPDNASIELMTVLKAKHGIDHRQVEAITVEVNWLETYYPSPVFPSTREFQGEGTAYQVAYVCVHGSFPRVREQVTRYPLSAQETEQVNALMQRITVTGQKERAPYAPRIVVTMRDGRRFEGEYTGHELEWGFKTGAQRLREVFPYLPLPTEQLERLVACVAKLE